MRNLPDDVDAVTSLSAHLRLVCNARMVMNYTLLLYSSGTRSVRWSANERQPKCSSFAFIWKVQFMSISSLTICVLLDSNYLTPGQYILI